MTWTCFGNVQQGNNMMQSRPVEAVENEDLCRYLGIVYTQGGNPIRRVFVQVEDVNLTFNDRLP